MTRQSSAFSHRSRWGEKNNSWAHLESKQTHALSCYFVTFFELEFCTCWPRDERRRAAERSAPRQSPQFACGAQDTGHVFFAKNSGKQIVFAFSLRVTARDRSGPENASGRLSPTGFRRKLEKGRPRRRASREASDLPRAYVLPVAIDAKVKPNVIIRPESAIIPPGFVYLDRLRSRE